MSEKILNREVSDKEINKIFSEIINLRNNTDIVNSNLFTDLEIFSGINKEDSIFDIMNLTQTEFGNIYLTHLLSTPIKDINILKKRQNIINKLNSNILKNISEFLDEIKKEETNIVWLLRDKIDDEKKIIDSVYFSNKYLSFLNKSEDILTLFTYFKIIFAPVYGVISPIIFVICPYLYLYYFSNIKMPINTYIKLFKATIFGGFNFLPQKLGLTKYVSIFLSFVIYIQNFFNTIKVAQNTNNIVNTLHGKIKKFNKFIFNANKLYDLTKHIFSDSDYEKMPIFDEIFDKEPSLISNKGKILKTFKEIEILKNKCRNCFVYIGIVDSFASIRKLVNELESKNCDICYTKYLEKDVPKIIMNGVWHPYLSKFNRPITSNNIHMGDDNKNNVIITGPNAGGKSTFIKSISISLLFSQTLGISFSRICEITPFNFINTYLNIPDCKGKESLFEAEMNRCKEYLEKLENLKDNEFSFIIMDEIFSSTNPKEGISGAYAICDKISTFKNVISVVTTHFSKLTEITKTNKTFKNYKIPIERDDDNEIIYPYKIKEGISDQFIALELLKKKGFDKEIINNAMKICRKL